MTTPSKPLPTDLPIHSFPDASAFEAFLEKGHRTIPGIHLKLAKKASGIPSITGAEAVEIALCFGWIDGRANGLDENFWLVRFTPRRAKSIWSQKNVDTIGTLLKEDRVRPAGLEAVEAAKKDGRWERAYAGPATMVVPDDMTAALENNPKAKEFFSNLNKSDKYTVLWKVETASAAARSKRISALVQDLEQGKLQGKSAKANSKPAKVTKSSTLKKTTPKVSSEKKETATKLLDEAAATKDSRMTQPRRAGLRSRT